MNENKNTTKNIFPIIGVGASAGGLVAIEQFFSGMPSTEINMAFIFLQHLDPDHKSILTDLIQRYTKMQVFEIEDRMEIKESCAYILPPNRDVSLSNNVLKLSEPTLPRGHRMPIDFFFRSMALDQRDRAICIILSGTGSDGTLGIRAIKAEGGLVIVQDPESADFDGMPRSAIKTGLVDYILPSSEMPTQLITFVSTVFGKNLSIVFPDIANIEHALKKIFVLIRAQTHHDFSLYKRNTILRRIERRMALNHIESIDEYVNYLKEKPSEIEVLFLDLLIGVTNFFRDKEIFYLLEEKIIPTIFANRPANTAIRVWVPGCSTGEEAYSIAILLQEQMDKLKKNFTIQIFATDIDNRAIEVARSGTYTSNITADVSIERLTRFFVNEENSSTHIDRNYRINKNIRNMLIFSEQDIIKDPPFSKIDIISCRNLLIYMGHELQKQIIPMFHYALNPDGILVLGTSETVGEFTNLFNIIDRKLKIYQRKDDSQGQHNSSILGNIKFFRNAKPLVNRKYLIDKTFINDESYINNRIQQLTEKSLLQHFSAIGILVNMQGDILYIHGRTGQYLEPVHGEVCINILKMAREGLQRDLTVALYKSKMSNTSIHYPGLKVKTNGNYITANLTVLPLNLDSEETAFGSKLFVVILEESTLPTIATSLSVISTEVANSESDIDTSIINTNIEMLSKELHDRDEYLSTTNEQLADSNEELKSLNEEMQSVNEEMQSTNEELETSKEELQSMNEELATVNTELQSKLSDLLRSNNDMNNLLAGTGIGTIFVDHQLYIQRFTPSVTQVINLIPSDVGRPVGHIVSNLINYDHLIEDIQLVLDTLIFKEVEVQTKAGTWYLLHIRPYRTQDNVIEGAVITFVEISEMKRTAFALKETENKYRLLYEISNDGIIEVDMHGKFLKSNNNFLEMLGYSFEELVGKSYKDITPFKWQDQEDKIVLEEIISNGKSTRYQKEFIKKNGDIIAVEVQSILSTENGKNTGIWSVISKRWP
ncbi:MAG: PAS domain-containing protein [Oligoflexia bacterium]|nr:PAS domain-containing protein [Oligoflexia bacterium]